MPVSQGETLRSIAHRRGVSVWAVHRAKETTKTKPVEAIGNTGIYDAAGVRAIESQLDVAAKRTGGRVECAVA